MLIIVEVEIPKMINSSLVGIKQCSERWCNVNNVNSVYKFWSDPQDPPPKKNDIKDIINITNVLSTFNGTLDKTVPFTPNFLQINSGFFLVIFLVIFTGIHCGTDFFCNSHALLGESRGYCTKTKQEWPDSGSTLENIFCNFYEIIGNENSTQTFFLKLFGHLRDIPAKSRDIPPKKFGFPGFEGHTELFGPHPFTWKTPTPPENIRTKKFRFGFLFLAWN